MPGSDPNDEKLIPEHPLDGLQEGINREMTTGLNLDFLLEESGFTTTRTAGVGPHRLIATARPGHSATPDELSHYAEQLNDISVRLGELGRHGEGLVAIEEAVTIRRALAEADPATYLPNLAMSLNNLSADLGELGRHGEGLVAIEEAVSVYRTLAEADPATYLPNLAMSLNNLSIRLGGLGRYDEARAAAKQASEIRVGPLTPYPPRPS